MATDGNAIVREWALSRVGCPYIMGGTGQPCTVKYREARAAQYPDSAAKIRRYCQRLADKATSCKGCRFFDAVTGHGRPAYDCAQLARSAMKQVGISLVSGSNSQWLKTQYKTRGEISHLPRDAVCLVFRRDDRKMGHVGVYLGDGTVVHARGHAYGVVHDALGDTNFTHYMIPLGMTGGTDKQTEDDTKMETIRQGSKGETVVLLQERLNALGYSCGQADGIFGSKTREAVVAYQAAQGLDTDGIVGAATWAALNAADMDDAQDAAEKDEVPKETAELPVSRVEFDALSARVDALENRLKGGMSDGNGTGGQSAD